MDSLFQFGFNIIYALQTLSPALDGFMNAVSFMGTIEFFLVLLPFMYWAVDRRVGVRTLLIITCADFATSSLKLLFHEPRPYWLGEVKHLTDEPTYALPSSHSSSSTSVGGYFIMQAKANWIRVLLVAAILLIGISRLYLGAHFPHDVLFGWLVGLATLWGVTAFDRQLGNWFKSKPLMFQIAVGFITSVLFITVGLIIRLLISGTPDPASWSSFSVDARSVTHFFTLAGALFGTISGYALMRQYARFSTTGTWNARILRFTIGIISLLVIFYSLDKLFGLITPDETVLGYILRYIRYGFATFWTTFIAPWLFIRLKLAQPED